MDRMSLNSKANDSAGGIFRVQVSPLLGLQWKMRNMEPFWKSSIHGHSTSSRTREGDLVLGAKDFLRLSVNWNLVFLFFDFDILKMLQG